jgi:hypothetical protein
MIDTHIEHEGLKVFLSSHAYERLVERIYGQTTRDMTEPTRLLLRDARFAMTKPPFATSGGESVNVVSCWLNYDQAGVTFSMPCVAGYSGAHGHYLLATTVLTPVYKSRKPVARAKARKTPKRKRTIGGRHRALPAQMARDDG